MVKQGKGNSTEGIPSGFSARRFLSVADLKNVEARLFNYNGPLKEVSRINAPILAMFGSMDPSAPKPTRKYMEILKSRRGTNQFQYALIRGARHSFEKHGDDVARIASKWAAERLGKA